MLYSYTQVRYAVEEYACTAIDILARRTRLAFLNVHAAEEALPRIVEIMAKELKWDKQRQKVGEIIRAKDMYNIRQLDTCYSAYLSLLVPIYNSSAIPELSILLTHCLRWDTL